VLVALATPVIASAATAPPTADFTVTPSPPTAGIAASYDAVVPPAYRRATFEWDFETGPGPIFERQGASVAHVYATPGERQVTMRVTKGDEVKAVVTKTVHVDAQPAPTPGPPSPIPPAPIPPQLGPRAPGGADGAMSPITPSPIVRMAAQLLEWGARIRTLVVTTPSRTVVTARCRGKGCPVRRLERRSRGRPVRLRRLEGRLIGGIRLEVRVTQPGFVGKYTRFRIRAGNRPPLRADRCLRPDRSAPVRCSSR